jgi:hypothetical protein
MATVDEIRMRFEGNLDRVRNIIAIYSKLTGGGQGRRAVQDSDLLRAAVVLLHATLEDVLRSLAEVPLVGMKGKTKFGMSDLVGFRGRTVDDVISQSVGEYLERSNYNNPGDIRLLFDRIGVPSSAVDPYAAHLNAMMSRRHWIVHRADRNTLSGAGQHGAKSISTRAVQSWVETVEQFGRSILARF